MQATVDAGDYMLQRESASDGVYAFHINQREETIDLGGVSGALMSTRNMQMQTFVLNPWDTQQSRISTQDGVSPTLAGADGGGGRNPGGLVICLNDQGGQRMDVSENMTGTLRAQMDSHPPLVLTSQPETYCIAGNAIDRQPQNGGNGLGCQPDISYTITATDHHAVYQDTVGALCRGDEKGTGNQYVSQDKCIIMPSNFIRRLTPLECERLQGFNDGWTNIPGASDSARYKALGNSVALPCVDYVLRGVLYFLREEEKEEDV